MGERGRHNCSEQYCGSIAVIGIAASATLLVVLLVSRPTLSADLDLRVGDSWKYQHVDLWKGDVIGTSTRTVKKAGPTGGVVAVVDVDGARFDEVIQGDGTIIRPMPPVPTGIGLFEYSYLKFPLVKGGEWSTTSFGFNSLSAIVYRVDWTCKVEDEERVSTPAGQFDTFRVQCTGFWHDRTWMGNEDQTLWYAPAARWIIKNRYLQRTSSMRIWHQWESTLVKFEADR